MVVPGKSKTVTDVTKTTTVAPLRHASTDGSDVSSNAPAAAGSTRTPLRCENRCYSRFSFKSNTTAGVPEMVNDRVMNQSPTKAILHVTSSTFKFLPKHRHVIVTLTIKKMRPILVMRTMKTSSPKTVRIRLYTNRDFRLGLSPHVHTRRPMNFYGVLNRDGRPNQSAMARSVQTHDYITTLLVNLLLKALFRLPERSSRRQWCGPR